MIEVLVLDSSERGGIAQYTHLLASALVEQGVRPRLVTRAGWELAGVPRAYPVEPVLAAGQPYARSVGHLVRVVRATRPALVHVQGLLSTRKDGALLALLRALGPRIVVTAHNVVPHEALWLDRVGHWSIYRAADHVIAHNQATRVAIAETFHVPPDRLSVIPHGDYQTFAASAPTRPAARARLGVAADERLVVFFGAIRPYKGLEVLLAAIARLRERKPDSRLVVAGAALGGSLEPYRQRARALGISDAVAFTDRYLAVDEVATYLRAADVAAFPYRRVWESGSIHVAIALGCPIVATAVGGVGEVIRDGETGRLVPPDDPETLARALAETLDDPSRALACADRALDEERRHRGWGTIAARTACVYRRLIPAREAA